MEENKNAIGLAKKLMDSGYNDVRFFDDLCHHPTVKEVITRAAIPEASGSSGSGFQAQIEPILPNFDGNLLVVLQNMFQNQIVNLLAQTRHFSPLSDTEQQCRLCEAKVTITKYGAVENHVKRHCQIKTHQCWECTFGSNAPSKVIAHMIQQHGIQNRYPKVRSLSDVQPCIAKLTRQCFPDHHQQIAVLKAAHSRKLTMKKRGGARIFENQEHKPPSEMASYHCAECRLSVNCPIGSELNSDGPLVNHLRTFHTFQCLPWRCELCGWKNAHQWKVRRHICIRHSEKAHEVNVFKAKRTEWILFLKFYFVDLKLDVLNDEEESETQKMDESNEFWNNLVKKQGKSAETNGIPRQRDVIVID
ncbi:unnamed protein product [Caenorhabditis sp. 36 PRJEB53466]|nr:unnamed protein product [Caenorhabditis sp. 36 PRJEB53466]